MSLPVIVIGGGGHAKVLIEALRRSGIEVLGLTDPDPKGAARRIPGVPVLGDDGALAAHPPGTVELVNGVGSTGDTGPRRAVFERWRERGYGFATVVHPSAVVAPDAALAEGAQVMAGAVIQPGVSVGADAIVNTGAVVDHDCAIGEHAHIAPGAVLSGGVTVGAGAHVGTGAAVVQGVEIGAGAVVAAGAAVVGPVAPGATVAGVPARKI